MTTTAPSHDRVSDPAFTDGTPKKPWGYTLLGILRILVGFYFLWAFIDKLFGLGFATPSERAWLNGGSPTAGFLGGSIENGNPFAGVWEFFIGINPVTNILFMVGLLAIGICFILGIGIRVASIAAAAMYLLMYLAAFPMTTNPLYDDHLIMAVVCLVFFGLAAGDHVGLGKQWRRIVKGNPVLV